MRTLINALSLAGVAAVPGDRAAQGPIHRDDVLLRRALICVDTKHAGNEDLGLWMRSEKGEVVRIWEGDAYDARYLPDGRILVADRWGDRVLWLDADFRPHVLRAGLRRPVDVERAADGTIVVVSEEGNEVLGLDPETGATRWRRGGFSSPFDALPIEDGGLLVADSGNGRIVQLDARGTIVRQVGGLGFVNAVELLDDGGMLATNWTGGELIAIDSAWEVTKRVYVGGTLYRAARNDEGVTLVYDGGGARLVLYDSDGKPLPPQRFAPGGVDYEPMDEP